MAGHVVVLASSLVPYTLLDLQGGEVDAVEAFHRIGDLVPQVAAPDHGGDVLSLCDQAVNEVVVASRAPYKPLIRIVVVEAPDGIAELQEASYGLVYFVDVEVLVEVRPAREIEGADPGLKSAVYLPFQRFFVHIVLSGSAQPLPWRAAPFVQVSS